MAKAIWTGAWFTVEEAGGATTWTGRGQQSYCRKGLTIRRNHRSGLLDAVTAAREEAAQGAPNPVAAAYAWRQGDRRISDRVRFEAVRAAQAAEAYMVEHADRLLAKVAAEAAAADAAVERWHKVERLVGAYRETVAALDDAELDRMVAALDGPTA